MNMDKNPATGRSVQMPVPSQPLLPDDEPLDAVASFSQKKDAVQTESEVPSRGTQGKKGFADDGNNENEFNAAKKQNIAQKRLPQIVLNLVPQAQGYLDSLALENKLDATIMRKRLEIKEALKHPIRQTRKCRTCVSSKFYARKVPTDGEVEGVAPFWELSIYGDLCEDEKGDAKTVTKGKFSSFIKSIVIDLDKDLYGPDNHVVTWTRTPNAEDTDGFKIMRPGDRNVRITILLGLDYQPPQFSLDPRLAPLLGVHTQTRPVIVFALWQYIKTHKLQDEQNPEYINCDEHLGPIFGCQQIELKNLSQMLNKVLHPPDPIAINYLLETGTENVQTEYYDIDVEVDDVVLKSQMTNFLKNTANQPEIDALDDTIRNVLDEINQCAINRQVFLDFAEDPKSFIQNWILSQMRDLKAAGDLAGFPEERFANFYYQPFIENGVISYLAKKANEQHDQPEQNTP